MAPPVVNEVLHSPGQPLDAPTRAFFEPRFGHDFSRVRVHTEAKAAESARSVNALAYTIGEHIIFETGHYSPASLEGRRLLAHELAHVLQQRPTLREAGPARGDSTPVQTTRVGCPLLSRQGTRFPGAISRCREMGVPCPAPYATHGTICRLADCIPAATARLPYAISPGVCVYYCEDGRVCSCVLVGTRSWAVCTFTFCDRPGQAGAEPNTKEIADRALALAEREYGQKPAGAAATATAQAKLAVGAPGDAFEQEADRIADRVLSMGGGSIASSRGIAGDRRSDSMTGVEAPVRVVLARHAAVLQRQGGGAAPACPTAVNFTFTEPAHVPHCGGPALRAATNVAGVNWSLTPGSAVVDPGSAIAANGTITLAPAQAAGDINVRATAAAPAAGGCFFERPLTLRSHPVGIATTSFVAAAAAGNYGGTFDHVFDSADGNVASLENVGVGEQFTNVPNPAAATHNIVAPLNPFGGVFTLNTATLTPNATNNWFLTAAAGLGGTLDSVTIGQANINVGRFVQSASNPAPPQGLPATMTLLQRLHWFCPQRAAATRWIGFVTVAHSRTLRNVGGTIEFVTAVNGVEQVDAYVGATAVFNLTATPASTPRSAGPPVGGGVAPPARTIAIKADSLPAALPAGQAIAWAIVGNALGCAIAQDPADDHAAILTIGTTAGAVTVQATDSTGVNRARLTVVIT